jgi:hypothetical protein
MVSGCLRVWVSFIFMVRPRPRLMVWTKVMVMVFVCVRPMCRSSVRSRVIVNFRFRTWLGLGLVSGFFSVWPIARVRVKVCVRVRDCVRHSSMIRFKDKLS